jgi:prevent-host-death family protein
MYSLYIMAIMTVVQARSNFGDLLSRVQYSNERTLITRNGKPIAAIVSAKDLKVLQQALEDAEDIRDARKAMKEVEETGVTYSFEEVARELGYVPKTERARKLAKKQSRRKR